MLQIDQPMELFVHKYVRYFRNKNRKFQNEVT